MTLFAQNSKPAGSSVNKTKVIVRLLKEIDDGRALIEQLEVRQHALEDEISKANQAEAKLTEAYKESLLELGELRATIKFQKDALAEREKQVEDLRSDKQKLEKKLAASRKREMAITVVSIILIAIRFF